MPDMGGGQHTLAYYSRDKQWHGIPMSGMPGNYEMCCGFQNSTGKIGAVVWPAWSIAEPGPPCHAPPPACPADLKPLYRSESKAALLGQLFERLATSLEQSCALPPLQGAEGGEQQQQQQQPAPQALVW